MNIFETHMEKSEKEMRNHLEGSSRQKKCDQSNNLNFRYKSFESEEYRKYEEYVFDFFSTKGGAYGIKKVYRTKAIRLDGVIEMENDNVYYVEVKYTLSWASSCHARIEFLLAQDMIKKNLEKKDNQECVFEKNHAEPKKGIIVFYKLSDDWNRKWTENKKENSEHKDGIGWREFYVNEDVMKKHINFPVRIFQLNNECFRYYSADHRKYEYLDRKQK